MNSLMDRPASGRPPGSLRARHTLFALLVVGLVLLISGTAHLGLHSAQTQVTRNLEMRSTLTASADEVRAGLIEIHKSLSLFLLDPGVRAHRERIDTTLAHVLQHARTLHESEWMKRNGQRPQTEALIGQLTRLQNEIGELVATRLDPSRQYPALAVGTEVLRPNRDIADNALSVIFNEMDRDNTHAQHPQTYQAFLRIQGLWMKMLSNLGLYLANQLGSYNESGRLGHEQGITTMHGVVQMHFAELDALNARGKVGFESAAALDDLRRAVTAWHKGFEQVRAIHHGERWRMDTVIMKERITPRVNAINKQMLGIERAFGTINARDIATVTRMSARLTWSLWLVAGLSVAFVVLVLVTTNRMVLRPIALVTRALKAEAMGKAVEEMPTSRAQETCNLVDAFGEMHHQVRLRQAELEHRTLHDALTALPNRTLLFERIEHEIHLANQQGTRLCLLMLDLNRFKEINDTLGHQVGDSLLVEVGNRLRASLRERDTVARLGGDEFAVLLPDTVANEAQLTAHKLLDMLKQSFNLQGIELYVGASIGVAAYPDHGDQAQTLLQHADVAMYVAKRNQSGFALYDPDKDEHTIARLAMASDLRQAVEQDQLHLHYQPILSLTSGRVISVEALLRWNHPQHGNVSPELVIDLAEQTGLIGPLTHAVIDKALAQVARWHRQGQPLRVAVNLSMHNLHDGQLGEVVRTALQTHGVSGESLTLEMTESAMMANPRQVISALNELDSLGIRFAVDDFGTGFSSLSYLKSLPVDILKIDKSFVIGLDNDLSDQAIVQATLNLGHNLGLEVVAEGVETEQSWNLLAGMGCDAAQGYYMSKALPPDELEAWLKTRSAGQNAPSGDRA